MTLSGQDVVLVEAVSANGKTTFDRFTSFSLTNSITAPSEASFEVGDDGTFASLLELTALGAEFRVMVNSRPRLTGRVEMRDADGDAQKSSNLRFVVRTKLTDAFVAVCDPRIRVANRSIKDFVLEAYATIGVGEDQFVFEADVARDLITGKKTKGGRTPPDLEPIQEKQAKARVPETIFSAVDRHLKRHGFMHWDAPDGRIIVGTPDDTQNPLYSFVERRTGNTDANNLLKCRESQNVGQTPAVLTVLGVGGGQKFTKTKVSATEGNQTLADGGFQRPMVVLDEGIKTQERAQRRARREMAQRERSLKCYELLVDGLSYRDQGGLIPYAPDTVATLDVERLGGKLGALYVESVTLNQSDSIADQTSLKLVPRGVWVL